MSETRTAAAADDDDEAPVGQEPGSVETCEMIIWVDTFRKLKLHRPAGACRLGDKHPWLCSRKI